MKKHANGSLPKNCIPLNPGSYPFVLPDYSMEVLNHVPKNSEGFIDLFPETKIIRSMVHEFFSEWKASAEADRKMRHNISGNGNQDRKQDEGRDDFESPSGRCQKKTATFEDVMHRFQEEGYGQNSYKARNYRALQFFSGRAWSDITKADVEQYRKWLTTQKKTRYLKNHGIRTGTQFLSNTTVDRHIEDFRRMWQLSKVWMENKSEVMDYTSSISNFKNLFFKEKSIRHPHPNKEQKQRIIDACSPEMRPVVIFAFEQALRRGEIVSLKWTDVDLDNRNIDVRRLKKKGNGNDRLPLTIPVRDLLKNMRDSATSDFIFVNTKGKPFTGNAVSIAWRKIREKAGVPNLRFHDLRSYAPTELMKNGCNPASIQRLLGHQDIKTTMVYINNDMEDLRKAMDELHGKGVNKNDEF